MREISVDGLKQLFKQEAEDIFLVIVEITHPTLAEPIRLVNDMVTLEYSGYTYTALPFRFELPADVKDKPPKAKIIIDNINRDLIDLMRSTYTPLNLKVDIVRKSAADGTVTHEIGTFDFIMSKITYDATTLEADLTVDIDFLNESAVADYFSPYLFPALF